MAFSQVSDIIIINGIKLNLLTYPLDSYLRNLTPPIKFDIETSACWRGYQAIWVLSKDNLYLENIFGNIEGARADIFTLFDLSIIEREVKAKWFTGILKVPVRPIIYIKSHIQKHPKEILFKIENGNIIQMICKEYEINEETFDNPPMIEYEISKEEMEHEILCYKIMNEQQGNRNKIIFYQNNSDDLDDLPF